MPAQHSDKWRRCVEHVKARGGAYNPYAVCTARLGEESFSPVALPKVPQYTGPHSREETRLREESALALKRAKYAARKNPTRAVQAAYAKAARAEEASSQAYWAGAPSQEFSRETIFHACNAARLAGIDPPANIAALCDKYGR